MSKVAIVGTGLVGRAWAISFARAGHEVALWDAAAAAPAVGGAHAVVRLVDTRKVVAGDSLWGISERLYGDGLRYSQIYAANAAQIRNPRLIYPGQVFVLPQPF